MRKNRKFLIVLIATGLLLSGCISINRDFKRIRTTILENSNIKVTKKFEMGIGKSAISLVSLFVTLRTSKKVIDPGAYISQLNSVQIGQYKTKNSIENPSEIMKKISEFMKEEGWNYIVKHSSTKELTMIFIKDDPLRMEISDLFVVNLQENLLVLVDMNGELHNLIELAIKDRSLKVDMS